MDIIFLSIPFLKFQEHFFSFNVYNIPSISRATVVDMVLQNDNELSENPSLTSP